MSKERLSKIKDRAMIFFSCVVLLTLLAACSGERCNTVQVPTLPDHLANLQTGDWVKVELLLPRADGVIEMMPVKAQVVSTRIIGANPPADQNGCPYPDRLVVDLVVPEANFQTNSFAMSATSVDPSQIIGTTTAP